MSEIVIAALYRFVAFPEFKSWQQPLFDYCDARHIKGTLLLAHEGINGTVAGSREAIDELLAHLKSDDRFRELEHKESYEQQQPFYRLKIKLKKEIVTMGVEDIDPNTSVGTYVKAKDWNDLISSPDVVLVDTRNDYEVGIGTFKGAINPKTDSFRELPEFVENNLDPKKHKKVAMFCTGGIRCEKSTAFMKKQGFEEVYHLQGGILKYLEEVAPEESMWEGECFVFDNRVAVDHQLQKGSYELCHGCRMPITGAEKQSDKFIEGVACPHCYDKQTNEQRARFQEREKQIKLARARGQQHIGAEPPERQKRPKAN